MRQFKSVGPDEFNRFVVAYDPPLTSAIRNGVQQFEDLSAGDTFPDSLVAAFNPASSTRRRSGGYRIPATETASPLTPTREG